MVLYTDEFLRILIRGVIIVSSANVEPFNDSHLHEGDITPGSHSAGVIDPEVIAY